MRAGPGAVDSAQMRRTVVSGGSYEACRGGAGREVISPVELTKRQRGTIAGLGASEPAAVRRTSSRTKASMSSRFSHGSIFETFALAVESPWLQEFATSAGAAVASHHPEHSRVAGGAADNVRTIASAGARNTG